MPPVQSPARVRHSSSADEALAENTLSRAVLIDNGLTANRLTDTVLTDTVLTERPRPATRAARPRKARGPYPLPDDDWQERGACRTANPSLFFAPDHESNHQRRFRETAAKAICAHCPVRSICRTYALQTGELYGIWGGTTERERMRSASHHRRAAAEPVEK